MEKNTSLELGLIGNSTVAALVDEAARICWLCLPRLDGEPVFNALLGGGGGFSISLSGQVSSRQAYIRNTAILETILEAEDGASVKVTDFAPRFADGDGMFRPAGIVRQVTPLSGTPRVTVTLQAEAGWGARRLVAEAGGSHIRFPDEACGFRVSTNAPIASILDSREFALEQPVNFILGPDEALPGDPDVLAEDWAGRTRTYWSHWARALAVPLDWQEAVIRAAITLQMCVYEETGGIVAAPTTSIPEHHGSTRNWDYRYSWLRDSYFTVTALNRLSSMGTQEHYMRWVRNIVARTKGGHIQPVYGIGLEADLTESIADNLPGYRGMGPVRRGNQAAEHIQHDVYGQVVLGVAQSFFDTRLLARPGIAEFEELEPVGERAFAMHDTPDAGIWEFRTIAQVHTSSAILCWAACDRLAKIAAHLGLAPRADYWRERADTIRATVLDKAWNETVGAFTAAFGGEALDASVLLMAEIGIIAPDDPRYVSTVRVINRDLREGDHVFRYKVTDDFGKPKTAFTACTFWLIDALYRIGEADEARRVFETLLSARNHLGLLSEDLDIATGELWGNFPQTYCMVGIINSALLLSRPWSDAV